MESVSREPRWPLWTSVALIALAVISQAPYAWEFRELRHISAIPSPERSAFEEMATGGSRSFMHGTGATKCVWRVKKVASTWVRLRETCARPIDASFTEWQQDQLRALSVGSRVEFSQDDRVRCWFERTTDTHVLPLGCMVPLTAHSSS